MEQPLLAAAHNPAGSENTIPTVAFTAGSHEVAPVYTPDSTATFCSADCSVASPLQAHDSTEVGPEVADSGLAQTVQAADIGAASHEGSGTT